MCTEAPGPTSPLRSPCSSSVTPQMKSILLVSVITVPGVTYNVAGLNDWLIIVSSAVSAAVAGVSSGIGVTEGITPSTGVEMGAGNGLFALWVTPQPDTRATAAVAAAIRTERDIRAAAGFRFTQGSCRPGVGGRRTVAQLFLDCDRCRHVLVIEANDLVLAGLGRHLERRFRTGRHVRGDIGAGALLVLVQVVLAADVVDRDVAVVLGPRLTGLRGDLGGGEREVGHHHGVRRCLAHLVAAGHERVVRVVLVAGARCVRVTRGGDGRGYARAPDGRERRGQGRGGGQFRNAGGSHSDS